MKIQIRDVTKHGYCVSGIKYFCRLHGIDFKSFVKNGIDVENVIDIDDAMLKQVLNKIIKGDVDG